MTTPAPVVSSTPSAALPPTASTPAGVGHERCRNATSLPALTLDDYKHRVSCHLYDRNAARLYQGVPPPLLKSVIVLSLRVDAQGRPSAIRILRSNGNRQLDQLAIRSVNDAAPLPVPPAKALRNGHVEFAETWLFRDDDLFQLRSLAAVQATGD